MPNKLTASQKAIANEVVRQLKPWLQIEIARSGKRTKKQQLEKLKWLCSINVPASAFIAPKRLQFDPPQPLLKN